MLSTGISSSELARVIHEVEREVAAWSAGPAIGIVEVDDGLRKRAAAGATWPGATHRVLTASGELDALDLAGTCSLALLWICEEGAGAARVLEAARRRTPIVAVALRTPSATNLGAPVDAGGILILVPLRSERMADDFPALARACMDSWADRLARHARREIGRRLGERHSVDEVRAAGYDAPPRSRHLTLRETIAARLLAALRDHGLNVSSAAAELGIGRKAVYTWCRRYGVDLAALRRPEEPPRPLSRP